MEWEEDLIFIELMMLKEILMKKADITNTTGITQKILKDTKISKVHRGAK